MARRPWGFMAAFLLIASGGAPGSGGVGGDETDAGRRARTSPGDVSLGFLAFILLGRVVLTFVLDLFSVARDSSVGKLADALLDLGGGVAVSLVLLWLFARIRSWRSRKARN